jgi:antitoxin (DNA-binding transcriptional repressor) of toxin-antitoxin stability system
MALAISQQELVDSTAGLEGKVGVETVFIQKDGRNVAAIVPIATYETTREAMAQRAIQAMRELGEHLQRVATPDEIDELEKELHQLAR